MQLVFNRVDADRDVDALDLDPEFYGQDAAFDHSDSVVLSGWDMSVDITDSLDDDTTYGQLIALAEAMSEFDSFADLVSQNALPYIIDQTGINLAINYYEN